MGPSSIEFYRSPDTHSPLRLDGAELVSAEGQRFAVDNGVPNLVWPPELSAIEDKTKREYDRVAEQIYDAALDWQFSALREDEETVRELMVNMLDPKPDARILEVGCGTGRDSFRLARRLNSRGALFMQDLSSNMVHTCVRRMAEYNEQMQFKCALHYSISNATYLPFPSEFFDAIFHFGGFNEFSDHERAAREFARVVKPGGVVLFGDESVGPWLRGTEFGGIVTTNNPLFNHELPLKSLPVCARDVNVRWIMGNCFYVITVRKGDGPPPLDLDLPHKGWRGGTMRSRYFGVLEGVTPEAKELARKAAASAGLSVHEWLDRLVRRQAAEDIKLTDTKSGR
ncbi:MAG: class I SAM-dependent methyltransferase [Candidatus Acidiferrales bacterium]